MNAFVLIAAAIPALAWSFALVLVAYHARRLPRLEDEAAPSEGLPSLSIVVAARNEAAKIGAALASLLAIDYPDLEIILVNDRSEDGTGAIARRIGSHDARLAVVDVTALPEGWLGKNHALQKGLERARGELVLFTDADVHFAPDALRRAVAHMQAERLDHLASTPQLMNARPSMRLLMPAFAVFFMLDTQPWKAADPASDRHIGVGAFNLVRRERLAAAGGLEPIRLCPDDDLMLAKILKRSGARAGFALSGGLVRVEWYATAGEAIRGLEKNAFAHFDYSVSRLLGALAAMLYVALVPPAGLALLPAAAGWLSLLALAAMLLLAAAVAHENRIGAGWALLFPVGCVLLGWASVRSMWLALARGGIVWRGTFHPLSQLKANRPRP